MDYNDSHYYSQTWDWHGQNSHIDKNSCNTDIYQEIWNTLHVNAEDVSQMFDKATPAKACGDFACNANSCDNIYKEPEECRQTNSQVKRRRMLQFNHQNVDASFPFEEASSPFFKSKEREDSLDHSLQVPHWTSGNSLFSYENVDQSSEAWLAEYFNDANINDVSPDNLFRKPIEAAGLPIDITEMCNMQPKHEANSVQENVTLAPANIIFKGRKSFIRTPTTLASSVAYPFAFIKPSGTQGHVTLSEINQRICTPPPPKSKQSEDISASFPKSAFSGKPVVGKTKIRTDGGKGLEDVL